MTMKTGLMTGALALVLGGFLASCSHDDDFSASIVDSKTKAYEEVFVETFGKIDPTHDWGFGASSAAAARTRACYPNANMWADAGYNVPDVLTDSQLDIVRRWFQAHKNPVGVSIDYSEFFVQQVYKGGTNLTNANSDCAESYQVANGSWITGGSQMDYLTAGTIHDHIYNFNNADCSVNSNVQNADKSGSHSDKIQLMYESSTNCFGYWNSAGSVGYDDKYVIISGATIDAWATEMGITADKVAGRYFVGFDFEQLLDPKDIYAWDDSANDYLYYEYNGKKYHYISAGPNAFCGESFTCDDSQLQQEGFIQNLLDQGYLPTSGGALKQWYRISKCANGYFTDWIVCITPGKLTSEDPDPIVIPIDDPTEGTDKVYMEVTCDKGRVFCEDLGNISRNDLDFNDVVFDAYVFRKDYYTTATGGTPYSTEYETYIVLLAAGGTIPVSLAGISVHDAMGGIATGTIINTTTDADGSFGNNWVQADPVLLDADPVAAGIQPFSYTSLSEIPIVVQYSQGLLKLQYSTGAAPHKICVRGEFPAWCRERVVISTAYTRFKDYVGDKEVIWWTDVTGGIIVNDNLYPNIQPGDSNYPTLPLSVTNGRVQVSGSDATGGYTGTEVLSRRRH